MSHARHVPHTNTTSIMVRTTSGFHPSSASPANMPYTVDCPTSISEPNMHSTYLFGIQKSLKAQAQRVCSKFRTVSVGRSRRDQSTHPACACASTVPLHSNSNANRYRNARGNLCGRRGRHGTAAIAVTVETSNHEPRATAGSPTPRTPKRAGARSPDPPPARRTDSCRSPTAHLRPDLMGCFPRLGWIIALQSQSFIMNLSGSSVCVSVARGRPPRRA